MKIKMLKSTPGAIDGGLRTIQYKEGLIYNSEDMLPGNAEIFIDIGVAQVHEPSEEYVRHQKGLSGAPENKRVVVSENKEPVERLNFDDLDDKDPDDGDSYFTLEELEGAKAKEIRKLAEENNIDLTDFAKNTAATTLINAYLARQGV